MTLPSATVQTVMTLQSSGTPLARSDAAPAGDRDYLIARVYQLLDFQIELADDGEYIAPELPDTVMAPVGGVDLQRCPARVRDLPDDVLGVGLEGRHVVATDRPRVIAGKPLDHYYDQIAWFTEQEDDDAKPLLSLRHTGRAGMFDWSQTVLGDSGLTNRQKSFRMSDHWVEFEA